MNIFALDRDPKVAASWLCTQHISKMVVESCQMLATLFPPHLLLEAPRTKTGGVWRHSHQNHPCTRWTALSMANALWLLDHAEGMEEERMRRGYNPHSCMSFLTWVRGNLDRVHFPCQELTEFAVAINESCKCRLVEGFEGLDSVAKYRLYYVHDKPFATWKRNRPWWMP